MRAWRASRSGSWLEDMASGDRPCGRLSRRRNRRLGNRGVRTAPRLDMFKPAIDKMLRQDLDAPRKQRHTARRIFARLAEEHDATDLSYSTVRDYVRRRRPEIDLEAGRLPEVFIPQEHAPGAEAEVDFEVWVLLAGVKTKCHMFAFRLSHSGKAVHRIYPTQAQEAFLEGHIDAFYCHPGIEGAHEKGGIEGDVGRFRRTHLSPMPVVDSLAELNQKVRQWDLDDEDRRIGDRIRTVAQDFALERELLAPTTAERFEPGLSLTPRVSRSSLVRVRMASYSVPARFIGRPVRVSPRIRGDYLRRTRRDHPAPSRGHHSWAEREP